MRWLAIFLFLLPLGGCVTAQGPALPMALGPDVSEQAQCLHDGSPNSPAYGDCQAKSAQH